jgi:integrase
MKLSRQNVAAAVRNAAGKTDHIEWDDELSGFGLRIRAGGKRSWIVQYRLGQKQRRFTLGTVEALDADKARKNAKTALAQVQLGADPQAAKMQRNERATDTFEVLVARYLKRWEERVARGERRQRSYEEVKRHLQKHCAPLNRMVLHNITRRDIVDRLEAVANESGGVTANRVRATLMAFFGWLMSVGVMESNPVLATEKLTEEQSRDRILTPDELVEIWNACEDDDYGRIVKLLMLNAQRRDEVGGMRDDELLIDLKRWSLPATRTKNKRPHDVPLSEPALRILEDVPPRKGRQELFGRGNGSYSGWSRSKEALDERIMKARKERAGGKRVAPLVPWTLHDLRRTADTGMNELGIQPHIVEAVLNHVATARSSKAGIAGTYNRAQYWAEKADALDRWAKHVEALVAGTTPKVVALSAPAKSRNDQAPISTPISSTRTGPG